MSIMLRSLYLLSLMVLLLQSCQAPPPDTAPPELETASQGVRILSEAQVIARTSGFSDPERLLPDILFAALQALDNDRLLTPWDDNAHDRFVRALIIDPGNEIALQGLQDIVARYLVLSEQSSRRGIFEQAQAMIERAQFIDATHPGIEKAKAVLQAERDSGDLFFELDEREFANRSNKAQETLADIAEQAKEYGAFFLITAPSDDLARWMFGVMRDAISGYRLRGNIELASRTTVRLRMPSQ